MTNRLDDDATESMNEGRGLCRVLSISVAFISGAAAVVILKNKKTQKEKAT